MIVKTLIALYSIAVEGTGEDQKCLTDKKVGSAVSVVMLVWCGFTESAGWSSVSAVSAVPTQQNSLLPA